ncbi:MAG TPA: sigma 54-interacting transcriptional regulator, partial [Gammaproteobacteria bacterium]|nr:sigma 54-interacting transcriptional regulator [Gammaproteobacteria bacterium]
LQLQSKLLRVLETGAIRRLGGTDYIPVDVRIIAATHRDLPSMVEAGQFRHDLYYRLSAFPIEVPTLRERKDDIPALAEYFLSHLPDGERQIPLSPSVTERLLDYEYPGNVRELGNIIERAAILAGDGVIEPEHVRLKDTPRSAAKQTTRDEEPPHPVGPTHRRQRHSDEEVLRVLTQCDGHRLAAAQRLGMSERTLYRRLQRMRG